MPVRRLLFAFLLFLLAAGAFGQTRGKQSPSRRSAASTKLQHITRAFVASAELKPMAQQLLANRTPQAYAGVESYARSHQKDDAGPLAWLVLGYAHYLDKDYAKAQAAWQSAGSVSPLLGDYLDYLRALAYHDADDQASVLKVLDGFERKYPDSLYLHESALLYAGALTATGSPRVAVAYLEKRRDPLRADTELLLGRAYAASGEKAKATDVFRRIYFEMPMLGEAEAASVELQSLGETPPAGTFAQRRLRAGLLLKGKRYQQAVTEYSPLV
ncbi:MAG TPA: hypothetical protein VJ723_08380, partial [Candidatus Angelobacter sp.]|nr:hypothetical protein [Candidatus Angelobacter sp.]